MRYFLFYILLSIGLLACAQSKNAIKNVYGIYEVHLPGNIAVDRNGNEIAPRDTLNFVYIETSSDEIEWNAAWKNDKTYSVISTLIHSDSFDAGTKKATDENMLLHKAEGNKLWQLRLIPSDRKTLPPIHILPGEIIIQGSYKGKKIMQKITQVTEVNSIPSV